MEKQKAHTFIEMMQFKRYEEVRASGRFNMFDSQARAATGLDRDEYAYVMENYTSLGKQAAQDAAA